MRGVSVEKLSAIRAMTLGWLTAQTAFIIHRMMAELSVDYRGMKVAPLPPNLTEQLLREFGVTPAEVSINIVRVDMDLSAQLYTRSHTISCIAFLGESEWLPQPTNGRVRRGNHWYPAIAGDMMIFAPGATRAFMVSPEGVLYFLEVASPPVDLTASENDDYVPRSL